MFTWQPCKGFKDHALYLQVLGLVTFPKKALLYPLPSLTLSRPCPVSSSARPETPGGNASPSLYFKCLNTGPASSIVLITWVSKFSLAE